MSTKIISIIILVVFIIAILIGVIFVFQNNKIAVINSFEECALAGYPIMESYPEQCKTPDGRNFIRTISQGKNTFGQAKTLAINESVQFTDGVSITLLEINDSRCKAEVVCVWAGELSAKLNITGGDIGDLIKEFTLGMTTKKITVIDKYTVILNSATENSVNIIVTKESTFGDPKPCYIGGCSGQICSDQQGVVSTCEYKEEYACYKSAKCERQQNGQCGWTDTVELTTCLSGK